MKSFNAKSSFSGDLQSKSINDSTNFKDTKDQISLNSTNKTQSVYEFLKNEEENDKIVHESNHASTNLQCQLSATQLELEEAYNTINALKEALEHERENISLHEKDLQNRHKKELTKCKEESHKDLESKIKAIELLNKEKENLDTQFKEIVKTKAEETKRYERKIKLLEENKNIETKKMRETIQASEKAKREKWIETKTQEIKESTLRGIEPEIQKIVIKNQQELKGIQEKHAQEIKTLKQKINTEINDKVMETEQRLNESNYISIQKLTNEYEEKIQNMAKEHSLQLNDINQKWTTNFEEEKSRQHLLREKEAASHTKILENIKSQYEQKIASATQSCNAEMKNNKLKYEQAQQEIEIKVEQRVQDEIAIIKQKESQKFKEKLAQLKEKHVEERAKEIDVIVSKLGEETQHSKKQLILSYEQTIAILNEKHTSEIDSITKELSNVKAQSSNANTKLNNAEFEFTQLQKKYDNLCEELKYKESEINEQKQRQFVKLSNDSQMEEVIQQKMKSALLNVEKQREDIELRYRQCIEQINLNDAQYSNDLEEIRSSHSRELNEIKEEFGQQIKSRDIEIKKMKEEVSLKETQINKYKELLDKQRRDMLFRNKL